MKNLHKQRRKNRILLAVMLVLLVCSVVMPKVLQTWMPSLFATNPALFSTGCTLIFWAAALVIFLRNFRKMVIVSLMMKNERTLRSDRASFPSASGRFDEREIRAAFEKDGFSVEDTDDGFRAVRKTPCPLDFTVVFRPSETNWMQKIENRANAAATRKPAAYVLCTVKDTVSEEERDESKNVRGKGGTAVMRVFCETSTGNAYYMGGFCGRSAAETAAQKGILHNILLRDSLPEKTDADKTDDENRFDSLDIGNVFYQLSHPVEEERRVASHLADGEWKIHTEKRNGILYYRMGDVTVSHPFRVESDGSFTIPDPAFAYTCTPTVRRLKAAETVRFKTELEKQLTDAGQRFRYTE